MNIKTVSNTFHKLFTSSYRNNNNKLAEFLARLGYGDEKLFHKLLNILSTDISKELLLYLKTTHIIMRENWKNVFDNDKGELTITLTTNKEYVPFCKRPRKDIIGLKCVLCLFMLDWVIQEVEKALKLKTEN